MWMFDMPDMRRAVFGGLAGLAAAVLTPGGANATAFLPDFSAATFVPGAAIDNPYFPVNQPIRRVYVAEALRGPPVDESFELSNIGPGPTILGVQTQIQFDNAFENGLLVEQTHDYYAQDSVGNVWYFGEDVTNFIYDDDGNLIETNNESAWRAGVNGALPGFIMPVDQTVGFNYFQEFAEADDALDQGTVFATGLTLMTDFGDFTNVLQVLETSALSPDARAFKYYAPGFGLVLEEEGLDANFQNPVLAARLVSISAIPEPANWAMMVAGFALIGGALRRRGGARTLRVVSA